MLGFAPLTSGPVASGQGAAIFTEFVAVAVVSGAPVVGTPAALLSYSFEPVSILAGTAEVGSPLYLFGGGSVDVDIGGKTDLNLGDSRTAIEV